MAIEVAATSTESPPPEAPAPPSVGTRAVRGLSWMTLSYAGSKTLTFISTVVLARLLDPWSFGLLGFVLVCINVLAIFRDLGVGSALIYRRDRVQEAANTAFYLSLLAGVGLFAAAWLVAPLAADYFRQELVEPMLRLMAVTFIISAFGSVQAFLLQKELQFRKTALLELAPAAGYLLASVGFAIAGHGAWSLIYGHLVATIFGTIMAWFVSPWRPRLTIDWGLSREIVHFSKHVMVWGFLIFLMNNLHFLIGGRILGETSMGLFLVAFNLATLPVNSMSSIITKLLFPAFSKLADDRGRLEAAFLKTLRYLALVGLPIGVGMALVSNVLAPALYGPKWAEMAPVLSLLALMGAIVVVNLSFGEIYKAIGRPEVLTWFLVIRVAVLAPLLYLGGRVDVVWLAAAHLIAALLTYPLNYLLLARTLGLRPAAMLRQLAPGLLGVLGMTAVVAPLNLALLTVSGLPALLAAIMLAGAGAAAYAGTLFLAQPALWRETVGLATLALGRRR
ncbi:MAG: lipopolysaccharide biosynthesis protein [Chloroflexi bacterium]|nr:lipopolysaccharide biosynthesis protein [Chloroflexota bacterium]